jgi:hypothetical protein
MISQQELTATANRLTEALAAAAAIMPPDETSALSSQLPSRLASPASRRVRRRMGLLRAWLIPAVAAAGVTAIILTAVTLAGNPGTGLTPGTAAPAPGTGGPAQAPASAGSDITSLAGVPSDSGTQTSPPPFYVTIVGGGLSQEGIALTTVQVRRTSDGQVTGTWSAPAGLVLARNISVTADDRTFTVAAETQEACGLATTTATQTRFYQFSVTSTGQITAPRAVGKLVVGEPVSEFAASPDGTEVAYAQQGCAAPLSAASYAGVIDVMNLTSGAVRNWHNTVSAATPARVTTEIEAMSWTADGRTLVADYLWEPQEGSPDLAVLGLDATSSGGSLQAHSQLLFSQDARCTVCLYTALISPDGSTLTAAAETAVPPLPSQPGEPWYRLLVLQLSVATGQPSDILYRSAPSVGTYEGLVPTLSTDGPALHWLLWNDPEQYGWISGGKQVPLPKAPSGVLAIIW